MTFNMCGLTYGLLLTLTFSEVPGDDITSRQATDDAVCSCVYKDEVRTCSPSVTCETGERALCFCATAGCTWSCDTVSAGSGETPTTEGKARNDLRTTAPIIRLTLQDGTLGAFREHLEHLSTSWSVLSKAKSKRRVSKQYSAPSIQNLALAAAKDFDVCVRIDQVAEIIAFIDKEKCLNTNNR